jgi:2-dehydropantoate 2-reductase
MRVLVVGAGATGGAFGTRLQEAGRDVTYLVRTERAAALRAHGLTFEAPDGTRAHPVNVVTAGELSQPYDIVIVAVKSGAFPAIIGDIAPAVGPGSLVIPFLNGMAHIDQLRERFGDRVLGGLVKIVATVRNGDVVQMTPLATVTVGPLAAPPERFDQTLELLRVPGVDVFATDDAWGALWAKWAFIASAGVVSCLFRNAVGNILEAGGHGAILDAIDETEAVAAAAGHPVGAADHAQSLDLLTEPGSAFTSSLYRDVVAGNPTETEHILGDLAARADALGVDTPLLDLTLIQLRAGEIARLHNSV